jgi:hypothetical protein
VKHIIPVIERKDLVTSVDIDDDLDTESQVEDYIELKSNKYINDIE